MTQTELFIQLIINGVTIGSYLALIALGYTMVYGIVELINFAHGDLFAFGFFFSLMLFGYFERWFGIKAPLSETQLLWVLPPIFLITMLATGSLNMLIDRVAYKRLRNAPRL